MSSAAASGPSRKRKAPAEPAPADDGGLGGLYDFLPPPDPEKDKAAKDAADKRLAPRTKLPEEDRGRVIFLDIDGVLLPAGSVETIFIDGVALPVRDKMCESDFSAAALGNLRSIVERTAATIVLASEWRRTEAMRNSITGILKGQDMHPLRDFNPVLQPRPELVKDKVDQAIVWCDRRAREITKWLKEHKEVTAWVVLDDLDFNWADSVRASGTLHMKPRTVLSNAQHCLTEEDADKAVQILLEPPCLTEEETNRAIMEAVRLTQEALSQNNGTIKMG